MYSWPIQLVNGWSLHLHCALHSVQATRHQHDCGPACNFPRLANRPTDLHHEIGEVVVLAHEEASGGEPVVLLRLTAADDVGLALSEVEEEARSDLRRGTYRVEDRGKRKGAGRGENNHGGDGGLFPGKGWVT